MNKILWLSTLLLVTGCASIPESPIMPVASQLVLMAEGNNKAVDTTPSKYPISPNIACNKVDSNKLDINDILSKIKNEGIEQKTGLTSDEIKDAAKLLYSGQFRSDIREIVLLAISIIPELANTLPQSGVVIHRRINELKSKTQPENISKCIDAISVQQHCSDINTLHDLLNELYHDPNSELVKATLVTLLENDSFRLALILYAHSNGIDINNADLDFVQTQLRKPDIDIVALREEGEKRLKEKYKINEVKTKMDALTLRCQ